MRVLWVVVIAAACGDNITIAPPHGDAPPTVNGHCVPTSGTQITLRQVATTEPVPVLVTSPPDDGRLFVVGQAGDIKILDNGAFHDTPFLDLSMDHGGPVVSGGEQGLLGLAFHPDYKTNGTFFVFYTTSNANVVARYQRSADPEVADPASGVVVLSIPDMFTNHNGGMIDFGPDGDLYVGTGDGGSGGDPFGNGQNTHALLGKLLRLDVDHKSPGKEYGIPPTNPYADGIGGAPEAYLVGTRNPWRWAFDRLTHDLWIGDVGQAMYEELDVLPAGTPPGANLGWNMYEGTSCYQPPCDPTNITMPVMVKDHEHDGWCAIIGGDVYRGDCYPDLAGTYFFTDYCAHVLGAAKRSGGNVVVDFPETQMADLMAPPIAAFPVTPTSLHADSHGELYLATASCCGTSLLGGIYHLEAGP